MALRDAIKTVVELWSDVQRRLGEADSRLVNGSLRSLVGSPQDETLMSDIVHALARVLPLDHPVIEAIEIDEIRSAITSGGWQQVIEELDSLLRAVP